MRLDFQHAQRSLVTTYEAKWYPVDAAGVRTSEIPAHSQTVIGSNTNIIVDNPDPALKVWATFLCSGAYESTTAVNAFRFLMSSGNIASGTIRVYGLRK